MNKKIAIVGFIVMLLVNAVLIFLLLKKPERRRHKNDFKMAIIDKLSLDDGQQKEYFELAHVHRDKMSAIRESQKDCVRAYFNTLTLDVPDSEKKKELLDKIKTGQEEKITVTYEHFEALKSLCNEEQQEAFNEIVEEMVQVLIGGRRGRAFQRDSKQ